MMETSPRYILAGWCVFFRSIFESLLTQELYIADGSARQLINKFDVKKRAYYGNTSMDAEISLLMANQSMVSEAKAH